MKWGRPLVTRVHETYRDCEALGRDFQVETRLKEETFEERGGWVGGWGWGCKDILSHIKTCFVQDLPPYNELFKLFLGRLSCLGHYGYSSQLDDRVPPNVSSWKGIK